MKIIKILKKLFTKKEKTFETYEEMIKWINSPKGQRELEKRLKQANAFSEELKKESKVEWWRSRDPIGEEIL